MSLVINAQLRQHNREKKIPLTKGINTLGMTLRTNGGKYASVF